MRHRWDEELRALGRNGLATLLQLELRALGRYGLATPLHFLRISSI